ncbi:hypothetical protein [Mycoreovirus 3]|uniref:Uncharacterized protein n=1 Tax=Rosellinia necatrix mycoreovirus 3 (isolate W370) TaxID=311229 RepID=Q76IC8_MYRVW|nr:hypothetical protein [Mycoreovirus 3]BAC87701.1 hypothetical protein [Mycoreovirus 3]
MADSTPLDPLTSTPPNDEQTTSHPEKSAEAWESFGRILKDDILTANSISAVFNQLVATRELSRIHANSSLPLTTPAFSVRQDAFSLSAVKVVEHVAIATPEHIPHFYALRPDLDMPSGDVFGLSFLNPGPVAVDSPMMFPFEQPTIKKTCHGLNLIGVVIDVSHPGITMRVNPYDLSDTVIRADGIEEIDMGQYSGGLVTENDMNGKFGLSWFLGKLFDIIGVSFRFGRFLMVSKIDDKDHCLTGRLNMARPDEYARISGQIMKDDYERYPHYMEVIARNHDLDWVRAEVRDHYEPRKLGTVSEGVNLHANRKLSQICYTRSDTLTKRANFEFLSEMRGFRLSPDAYRDLLGVLSVLRQDIGGRREMLRFRKYDVVLDTFGREAESFAIFMYNQQIRLSCDFTLLYSAQFRQDFRSIVEGLAASVLRATVVGTPATLNANMTRTRDSHNVINTTYGQVGFELIDLTINTSIERVARCIALELMPDWYDISTPRSADYGTIDSRKFAHVLLATKIAFLMNPLAYERNRHVKAAVLFDFIRTFLPDVKNELFRGMPWGYRSNGTPVMLEERVGTRRISSNIERFTLLEPIPPRNAIDPAGWNLMTRVLAFLNAPGLSFDVQRDATRYSRQFTMRIPGQASTPLAENSQEYLVVRHLTPAFALMSMFDKYVGRLGRQVSKTTAAAPAWRTALDNFIHSFGEWFHTIYCFAAYCASLLVGVTLPYDNLPRPGADWRSYPSMCEDPDALAALNVHGAPRVYPTVATFPHDELFFPILPSEGLYVALFFHGVYSRYFCGALNPSATGVDWDNVRNYYFGVDPRDLVDTYRSVLQVGHVCGETIDIVARVSTRSIFQGRIRQLVDVIMNSSVLTAKSYAMLAKHLGFLGVDRGLGRTSNMLDDLHEDPRVYAPMIGFTTMGDPTLTNPTRIGQMCRPAILTVYRLLVDAVFSPEIGVLPVLDDISVSYRRARSLQYDSHHAEDPFLVTIKPQTATQLNTSRVSGIRLFSADVSWMDDDGTWHRHNALVIFEMVEDLLREISRISGRECNGTTVQIDERVTYNEIVVEMILQGLKDCYFVLSLPNRRHFVQYAAMFPHHVTQLARSEEVLLKQLMSRHTEIGCWRVMAIDTNVLRGRMEDPNLRKPILSADATGPRILVDGWNTADARVDGQPPDFASYFPDVLEGDDGRGEVVVHGRRRDAYVTFPFGFVAPYRVYTQSPVRIPRFEMTEISD